MASTPSPKVPRATLPLPEHTAVPALQHCAGTPAAQAATPPHRPATAGSGEATSGKRSEPPGQSRPPADCERSEPRAPHSSPHPTSEASCPRIKLPEQAAANRERIEPLATRHSPLATSERSAPPPLATGHWPLATAFSRRTLLLSSCAAAAAAATTACRPNRSAGFDGYAFVANEDGQALAAVDLTAFAVIRHVPLNGRPADVIAHPTERLVYALTPENGTIHQIAAERKLEVRRQARVAGSAISMRLARDGQSLYVLCREPRHIVRLDPVDLKVNWRTSLHADPVDFDVSPTAPSIAVSFGADRSFLLADAATGKTRRVSYRGDAGTVRFQSDGRAVIVANTSERMLSVYDLASARAVTHLPLAVRPDNLCFKPDGGQLFITGEGQDAVVVVYPYHTPQVAETVLAGQRPGAMAASDGIPGYLFVANPGSGDITILNITTRRAIAVASVGSEPRYITITPDNQYALVLNRKSGDMAVLRISNKLGNRQKSASLFTMIPVGSGPVSVAVRVA